MHACGFMLKSYCFRLGKKPGTYDKVDHQSLGHHMEKNKSTYTYILKLAYMCAHIHVLRLRRLVYKGGATEMLDAWNSKEMRVLAAKENIHVACMMLIFFTSQVANFPQERK